MAIQGNITHNGFEINAYIQASILGISKVGIRIPGPSYDPTKWADPEKPTQQENLDMTILVKKMMIHFSYSIKANSDSEPIGFGQDQVAYDSEANIFSTIYNFLADKLGISAEQV